MFAIAALFFALLYAAFSIAVISLVVRYAKARRHRPALWGGCATLITYLLVFWDHIPTLLLHRHYCTTQAGFWVYKTPEQWRKENPGVTVTWNEGAMPYEDEGITRRALSDRFVWEQRKRRASPLPVTVYERNVLDRKTNEVMTREVTVASGYGSIGSGKGSWKMWVGEEPCGPRLGVGQVLLEELGQQP